MQAKIKNQLLMLSGTIVSEQPSPVEGFRCWVAVITVGIDYVRRTPDAMLDLPNLDRSRLQDVCRQIYVVQNACVKAGCIENDWDIGPNDEKYIFREAAHTFEEIFEILKKYGVDDESFIEPWNTDYPL